MNVSYSLSGILALSLLLHLCFPLVGLFFSGMPLEVMPKAALELDKYRAICRAAVEKLLRDSEGRKAAEQAYGAWLGFYNGNKKNCGGWNNTQLVEAANLFSLTLGFSPGEPPALEKKTVGKMGLKGVPGLRLVNTQQGGGNYR